jgi:hypothetical protein
LGNILEESEKLEYNEAELVAKYCGNRGDMLAVVAGSSDDGSDGQTGVYPIIVIYNKARDGAVSDVVVSSDSKRLYVPPAVLSQYAPALLEAHKHSRT